MRGIERALGLSAFTVVVASFGCADAGARADGALQVDTLPGGAVQVTNAGEPAWTPGASWTLVEDLRLGSVSGAGPSLFAQVAAILPDSDGNLYVLDFPTQEIRVFSASGEHLRTIGGVGEGPGELRNAAGLDWGPDGRLWVWGSSFYQVLEPTGEEVARYPRLPRGVIYSWQGGFDDQGRYVDWGLDREMLGTTQVGQSINPVYSGRTMFYPIVFTPPSRFDTLPVLDYFTEVTGDGQLMRGGMSTEAILDGGHVWFVHTDRYAVYQRALTGDTLLVFTLPRQPEEVPASEIDSLVSAAEGRPGPRITADSFVRFRPVVTKVLPDRAGHVYVFPHPAGSAVDVFEESGRYLGQMPFPTPILIDRPAPYIDRDFLYAVEVDALGVPFVLRYRIVRPEGRP